MFNRGAFNRTPFNIPSSGQTVIDFAADLSGTGRLGSQARIQATGASDIKGEARVVTNFTRTFTASAISMHGAARIKSAYTRYIGATASLRGEARIISVPRRFRRETITFNGSFPPGSEIVIDLKRLIVTQNQVNALRRITGDLRLLRIMPGPNNIRYTDTSSNRQVRIRVTHKDRYK